MNAADRKLLAELFTAISDHLAIPEPREYTSETDKQQAALAWDRASDVRIFTGMDAEGMTRAISGQQSSCSVSVRPSPFPMRWRRQSRPGYAGVAPGSVSMTRTAKS